MIGKSMLGGVARIAAVLLACGSAVDAFGQQEEQTLPTDTPLEIATETVGTADAPAATPEVDIPVAPAAVEPPIDDTKKKRKQKKSRSADAIGVVTPSMRDVFAGTLAAVVQASGGALLTGIAQVVTGRLVDWFSDKLTPDAPALAGLAAAPAAEVQAEFDPTAQLAPAAAFTGEIVAGLAFEVHQVGPGGETTLVDPASHEFRTGERFVVFYRPSLPGRMEVFNINPAGQQALIDTQQLAAGQLTRMGPYEFTAMTGDEQLRLVLTPCSTPALVSATRDIVRVPDTVTGDSAIGLAACDAVVTRSVRAVPTRDIRKVAVEDGTSFALDPLSAAELASGQAAPRELTIRFRHR
jgi:hypothetical protein